MDTTSPENSLNWIDIKSLLKNIAIFFLPMAITLLTAVQSGQEITTAFVLGAAISSLIKLSEYYSRGNNLPK